MKITSLDHVALWVPDREALAGFLTAHLGMHVIERTDTFTIVGADARRGKLTLFAVEERREPAPLRRVFLRVSELNKALERLPSELPTERPAVGVATFTAPERLPLGLIEADGVDYDLDHVVLSSSDPTRSFAELSELGFEARDGRLWVGDSYIDLERGPSGDPGSSLLNHFGLRVASAAEHIEEARSRGLEIADVVDAPNTYAVFVWGPERVKLEYVEHKPSFSLV
jgi:catechol 2,3-dioxygenase-like lactoylglutathione lyase family enzyme